MPRCARSGTPTTSRPRPTTWCARRSRTPRSTRTRRAPRSHSPARTGTCASRSPTTAAASGPRRRMPRRRPRPRTAGSRTSETASPRCAGPCGSRRPTRRGTARRCSWTCPWVIALDDTGVLRVVIAEDNYLVREGLRRLLEDSGEIDVIASVGNGVELLDAVRRLGPDAVLTDIRMPPGHHMEGIEAAHAIRTASPDTGVVVLSQHADESYALALFDDGSAGLGYLLKDRIGDLEDLVHALHEVRA